MRNKIDWGLVAFSVALAIVVTAVVFAIGLGIRAYTHEDTEPLLDIGTPLYVERNVQIHAEWEMEFQVGPWTIPPGGQVDIIMYSEGSAGDHMWERCDSYGGKDLIFDYGTQHTVCENIWLGGPR